MKRIVYTAVLLIGVAGIAAAQNTAIGALQKMSGVTKMAETSMPPAANATKVKSPTDKLSCEQCNKCYLNKLRDNVEQIIRITDKDIEYNLSVDGTREILATILNASDSDVKKCSSPQGRDIAVERLGKIMRNFLVKDLAQAVRAKLMAL